MKKYILLLFLGAQLVLRGQSSGLIADDIAVFYPENYEAERHQPSFAIKRELEIRGKIPRQWTLIPQFGYDGENSTVKIDIDEDVDLYGNGEVTGSLRRNGTSVELWNTDNYVYKKHEGKRLYQSHPWLLGVRPDGTAFGVLADNTWKQDFDLKDDIAITSYGPPFRMVIIEKNSPQEVMHALADLIGTIPMPPLWALGYQQSRYSYYPSDSVRYIAREFRKRKIPADVIWMDIDYMDGYRIFTFDKQGFPDPRKLNRDLHKLDFKSVYMIDPGVKADEDYGIYQQGTEGSHWVLDQSGNAFVGEVWPGDCVFPDYTRPETQKWWASLYGDFMKLGIDGVWNDMNEPAVFDSDNFTMPETNLHRGGGDLPQDIHRRYHNVYGMLMVKASREGILKASPGKRPFVLSRANFLGGQRYAATWTGDNLSSWEYLKLSVPMSLNLSLSGQPFNGPDIGGFSKNADGDLLAHWTAIGVYFPFCRNHSSKNTTSQEPWAFGETIEDASRKAINRRYKLLPYLYTLFRKAHTAGTPVMQPVFFADVKDLSLRGEEETFLLGEDLLIIPQWAERPHLPGGKWETIPFEEEQDDYQATVKLRPGAIVPIADEVFQSTEDYNTRKIVLLINPDEEGKASGTLYDDEGNGFGFEKGIYSLHRFTGSADDNEVRVEIKQTEGSRKLRRVYKIGYIHDGLITYSDWSADEVITLSLEK
ncbi:TIM-barrel domain-containing protein [Sinomicrobium soli]|uniref:TIM-barrel domain-containing protein n=1 Tax=Sinomicrobium sp. N-1-3-6 TaxID=2219864 RepID=UPI000DCAE5F6|nr:TIM-barrel domain-containing protein [Sinomicrobium sp. N-1-3-6]RAV30345.1 alpha-glucosidase [Sinomicrobium sp. N-1-3-6]